MSIGPADGLKVIPEEATAPRRGVPSNPLTRAWLLSASLFAAASAVWGFVLRDLEPLNTELQVPWWGLMLALFVIESFVVHLHFRSETGTFSLVEIPLVFAILFSAPGPGVLAMVVGAATGLAVVRRQPVVKLAFNVANLSLHFTLSFALASLFIGGGDLLAPIGWVAVIGAATLSAVVNFSAIVLVIAITEGRFNLRQGALAVLFAVVVAIANTVQGLVAALAMVAEPWAIVLLACTAGILFIAYRGYVDEREQRQKVEFLYTSTRALREGGQSGSAVSDFLAETASMFRARTVLLYLFAAPDSGVFPALFVHRDGTVVIDDLTGTGEARARATGEVADPPRLVERAATDAALAEWLAVHDLDEALVGTLPSEERVVGVLVVGERLGNVATFTETDLRLFTTLVEHAAVSLENDQLGQALIQLREMGQELERQAKYDELTGLANRAMFSDRLDELYLDEVGTGGIVYIDLDDFKPVNDTYGHAAGDALLVQVAARIEATIRSTDLAARLGGDEFAVLLTDAEGAEALAQRLIGSLSAPYLLESGEVRIGASVGLAHRAGTPSASELVARADTALYAAKDEGKGTVVTYSDHLRRASATHKTLYSELRRAIAHEEFEVHYQPIVGLDDLAIVGAEALVRWRQPSGQLVAPDAFINEAEQSGLITSVDRLVRVQVLEQLHELRRLHPEFFVSINLSARHLRRSALVEEVAADLAASGAPVDGLVIELTESALAGDTDTAAERLGEVRALGPRIALDDFGTGYSSLSYLRTLPVDLLKIAQPFIRDLAAGDPTFVDAIVGLGQKLGFTTLAEGIEEEATVELLRGLRCDLGQGFHFARPMKLHELTRLLAQRQQA